MPGPRQPLAALEARGRKHLSQAEKNAREATEVHAEAPKYVLPPKYLPEYYKKEFSEISRQLLDLKIFSKLDRDTLAAYLIARGHWLVSTQTVNAAMQAGLVDAVKDWTTVQNTYFKQARQCANELGLTITSRCRLVIPKAQEQEEESPMLDNISKLFG